MRLKRITRCLILAEAFPHWSLTPQIAQAEAQLAAARSRAAIAALDLERTNFALPFEGIVTESSAEVGQLLSANRSFGQVFATDSIELVIPLSPADLMALDNQLEEVALKKGEYTATAIINRVSAELDERSRFAMAYANIPYTDSYPGSLWILISLDQDSLRRISFQSLLCKQSKLFGLLMTESCPSLPADLR